MAVTAAVVLACSNAEYQSPTSVFAHWTNQTGRPYGVAFIRGLLQSTFGLATFDGAGRMAEEMPRPSIYAPKTIVLAILLGASTSKIFVLVLLFCTRTTTPCWGAWMPLLGTYYQATSSGASAMLLAGRDLWLGLRASS